MSCCTWPWTSDGASFPFPVAGAERGVVGAGLFLIESNLFGQGKRVAAGAFFSNRGTSASIGYRDPAVAGTRLLFTADFARIDMLREQDAGMSAIYQFQDQRYDLGATLGWRIADRLTIRGGWFTLLVNATPTSGYPAPPRAPPVRGLSGEIEFDAQDDHLWHVSGFSTRLRYRQGVSWLASDRSLYQTSARASWSTGGFADHVVSLTASFDSSRGDPIVDALRLGGMQGSRGFLRAGLWAETAGTFTVEYQVPIWHPSWGIVSWAGFCDAGITRWEGTSTNYLAPGIGFRMYLRNLAIPAIGFDVAQATGVSSPAFSFAAGWRY